MPEQSVADRRIQRTKQMLRDALLDLIEERGLEGLTVRDLTEKAGLNRGTFYLHYRDIPDLLEQSKEQIFQGMIQFSSAAMNLTDAMDDCFFQEPHPVALRAFEYLAENGRFFSVMLGPNGDPSFCSRWKRTMKEQLWQKSLRYQPEDGKLPFPREYLVSYIVSAHFGVIQQWFESGMKMAPRDVAIMMTKMNYYGPKRVFETGKLE